MKTVSNQAGIKFAIVENIFKTIETCMEEYLLSADKNDVTVKILNGIYITAKVQNESKPKTGMFAGHSYPKHILIRAKVSSHYKRNIATKSKN